MERTARSGDTDYGHGGSDVMIGKENDNVYAPPEARVDDITPDGDFELADRSTRLGAAILDGLVPAVVGIVAAIALPSMKNSESAIYLFGSIAHGGHLLEHAAGLAFVNVVLLLRPLEAADQPIDFGVEFS